MKNADGSFSFSARTTGSESGIKDQALKTAPDAEIVGLTVKEAKGSYGEFLRVDLTGDYGDLAANLQTVTWTYYEMCIRDRDEYDVNVKITVADGKFSDIAVTPGSGYNTENATYFKKLTVCNCDFDINVIFIPCILILIVFCSSGNMSRRRCV